MVGKREGKLIFMNLNKLLCKANIHKCLLSNHSFIGLSSGFSNMFELIVVRLFVIILTTSHCGITAARMTSTSRLCEPVLLFHDFGSVLNQNDLIHVVL